MNTQTKAQRINKRHDAIWEEWLGGNGKDTIIQSGDELTKVTSQRDELLAACKLALDKLETFQPEIKTPVTQKILRAAIAKAESNQT